MRNRSLRLIIEFLSAQVGEVHEILKIMVSVTGNDNIIRTKMQLFSNYFKKFFRNIPVINKPYRRTPFSLMQAFRKLINVAFGYVISYFKLSIFRELNRVCRDFIKVKNEKDLLQPATNDIIKEYYVFFIIFFRKQYEPGEYFIGDF